MSVVVSKIFNKTNILFYSSLDIVMKAKVVKVDFEKQGCNTNTCTSYKIDVRSFLCAKYIFCEWKYQAALYYLLIRKAVSTKCLIAYNIKNFSILKTRICQKNNFQNEVMIIFQELESNPKQRILIVKVIFGHFLEIVSCGKPDPGFDRAHLQELFVNTTKISIR